MSKKNSTNAIDSALIWNQFKQKNQLSDKQLQQFIDYADLLMVWNKKFNITAITNLKEIIELHFQDSLAAIPFLTECKGLADVGSGGGFPAIPLKIMYPDLFMLLIEVNLKKVTFLHEVIKQLNLQNIEVSELDWRTFLRTTTYSLDTFCARASLSMTELLRLFKGASFYQQAQLIYWASRHFVAEKIHEKYIYRQEAYSIDATERRLIFFKKRV